MAAEAIDRSTPTQTAIARHETSGDFFAATEELPDKPPPISDCVARICGRPFSSASVPRRVSDSINEQAQTISLVVLLIPLPNKCDERFNFLLEFKSHDKLVDRQVFDSPCGKVTFVERFAVQILLGEIV